MRYVMKQELFSWGRRFVVTDESGVEHFVVQGKVFALGAELSFQDLQGQELAQVRQRLLTWKPTYEIYRGDVLAAVVQKELFTFFKSRFTVDLPGPDNLQAEGDFWDHEYAFRHAGRDVAYVSKKWFSFADTYGVDVIEGDAVIILATTVAIDDAIRKSRSS